MKPLRILYGAGPGDVAGTFQRWLDAVDDPGEVSMTFSGQFFDAVRTLGATAHVIAWHPERRIVRGQHIVVEHRPMPFRGAGGLRYHLGQLLFAIGLLRTVIGFKADMAIVDSGVHWFALALLSAAGVRVVPSLHNTLWPNGYPPQRRKDRLLLKLHGWFWRRCALETIVVSPECERQVRSIAAGPIGPVHQTRAQYRRGYLDMITPVERRADEPFRLMFAGRIEQSKGVFDVLEAAIALEGERPGGFEWEVCGHGSALDELRRRVERAGLGGRFRIRGKLNRFEMRDAYARCHAVVAPTRSDFCEGLTMVAIEAVLAGRPLITTRLTNCADVLQGAVVIVAEENVAALTQAIRELASDLHRYRGLAAACPAVQEQFYDRSHSFKEAVQRVSRSLFPDRVPQPAQTVSVQ